MGFKSLWRSLKMGSQQSNLTRVPSVSIKDEPLECVIKEHKRDEHLKNLGMKRNKSIRKSIAKKLRRKRDEPDGIQLEMERKESIDIPREPLREPPRPVQVETRTSIGSRIEGGTRVEVIKVVEKDKKDLVGDTQPLPGHIEAEVPRKMDKLRRSIRHSMRKRKESSQQVELTRADKWRMDEAGVRAGTCSFYVKYLGCCEVYESRGMQVCEAAVSRLKQERRRTVRGTVYVNGDSIRLVDDDTKGLVLDQTIEKVSFCAPDRNFEKGFSYICRDGTSRRWMCHGFMAVGDTGERLSHAVGCAFGICLENKQKRDKTNVSVQYNSNDSSFTRNGSFRVGTMTERLEDPQSMRLSPAPPKSVEVETKSVERPRPTETMYQRQASFRGLGQLSGQTPFKRHSKLQLSLRPNDLPSYKERRLLSDSPIMEDIELPSSNLEDNYNKSVDLLTNDDPFTQAELAAASGASGTSTPAFVTGDSSSTYSMSPPPSLLIPTRLHKLPETPESEHNPWDMVPDQPHSPPHLPSVPQPSSGNTLDNFNILSGFSQSNPVNSSLIMADPVYSSLGLNDFKYSGVPAINHWSSSGTKDFDLDSKFPPFINHGLEEFSKNPGTSSGYSSPSSTNSGTSLPQQSGELWRSNLQSSVLENSTGHNSFQENTIQNSILEDPFDAEWAAIATRKYSVDVESEKPVNTKNPFLQDGKTFELQL